MTRNPETRQTPSGVSVTDFTLACNRWVNGEQRPTYARCTCWNRTAEWLASEKGAKTGDALYVEGILVNDDFELTKGDSSTRTSGRYKVDNCVVEVVARKQVIDTPETDDQSSEQ